VSSSTFGSEPYLISIGNHVTVTGGVRFITHDGGVWIFREDHPDLDIVAPIVVGNNVFIGLNAIVLPGVTIGDDCVIGAGSVVTKDIPSGTVAAGVPARAIKSVAEYRESLRDKELSSRSLEQAQKREFLIQFFRPSQDPGDGK
jgi:acetyltransferase-like isoleucine patch superfamily enzyme